MPLYSMSNRKRGTAYDPAFTTGAAASDARPDPTMEDAFIHLVEAEDLADVARSEVAA